MNVDGELKRHLPRIAVAKMDIEKLWGEIFVQVYCRTLKGLVLLFDQLTDSRQCG